jgi:hypothetical protein
MKILIVPGAAVLLLYLSHMTLAGPPGKQPRNELATLEQKMVGIWAGGGCDGRLVLRADGVYELTDYGPAGQDFAGTWNVRWDALPPTLVLTCKSSQLQDEVGKTREVKLVKLDDQNLTIEYANQNGSPPGRYTRVKK